MVAYSFKARFAQPIIDGTKCQTIRADRKRHARVGEELQLYTGMRTKQCKLIRRAKCIEAAPIHINFWKPSIVTGGVIRHRPDDVVAFAKRDGFASWDDMHSFWKREHGDVETFDGILIRWAP